MKAIEYLKKGHKLAARAGFFEAGIAYQQLGDYKTAWVYMNKASWLPHGHLQGPDERLRAIEEGRPIIKPLPVEKLDFPETGSVPASDPDSLFGSTEHPDPFVPSDVGFSDVGAASRRAEAEARAKAEAARREEIALMCQMLKQEIDDFIQWTEQLMREEAAAARTTDFLAQEMAAHLTGTSAQFSPECIVCANEIVQQYGTKEGLQRLKISDPEIDVLISYEITDKDETEIPLTLKIRTLYFGGHGTLYGNVKVGEGRDMRDDSSATLPSPVRVPRDENENNIADG